MYSLQIARKLHRYCKTFADAIRCFQLAFISCQRTQDLDLKFKSRPINFTIRNNAGVKLSTMSVYYPMQCINFLTITIELDQLDHLSQLSFISHDNCDQTQKVILSLPLLITTNYTRRGSMIYCGNTNSLRGSSKWLCNQVNDQFWKTLSGI